jgi:hypothetical protein
LDASRPLDEVVTDLIAIALHPTTSQRDARHRPNTGESETPTHGLSVCPPLRRG